MAAASALRVELTREDPAFEADVVDSYKYAASVVSRVVSDGYLGMVKTLPQMYRFLYNRAERATEVGAFRTWIHQFTAGNLRGLLHEMKPDVVICTHAFPCGVMAEYKKQFADAPPVVGVVTDFAVHSFWMHENIERYAVATPEMRATMIARGIRPERIIVSGIPVSPAFGERPADVLALRGKLDLPRDRSIVLMMGGGLGIGPLATMMQELNTLDIPICAVAIVGRSSRSAERVFEAAHDVRYPMRVMGFVGNVDEYMHAADLLITKPGGLTSAEALAAEVPMVLFKPLPGQEERNTRYLVERQAAIRVKRAQDLPRAISGLLSSESARNDMRTAMRALAKPHAAREVAGAIRALAAEGSQEAIA
jgi:processive 1,2-diacylglycerol beta-glucosyltransferase